MIGLIEISTSGNSERVYPRGGDASHEFRVWQSPGGKLHVSSEVMFTDTEPGDPVDFHLRRFSGTPDNGGPFHVLHVTQRRKDRNLHRVSLFLSPENLTLLRAALAPDTE